MCFYSVFKTLMILIRGLDISFKFRFSEIVVVLFFTFFGILYIVRNVSCQWCIFHISILCKILEFSFCTLWQAYFDICSCFWLNRYLPAKQILNSKQYAKGYERIIREILRRSGYFSTQNY